MLDSLIKSKKKYIFSFLFGLLSAFAFAPIFLFPILWICFTYILVVLQYDEQLNNKSVLLFGWLFGFGHFIGGTYWICSSLLVEPEKFAWLIPFTISIIPAFLAFFIALPIFITNYFSKRFKFGKLEIVVLFAVMWSFFEMFRATVFTGFPWNLIAYTWGFSDSMIQLASVFGAYGLGFFTIIIFASPFLTIDCLNDEKLKCVISRHDMYKFVICVSLLPSIYFYGYVRLKYEQYLPNTGKIVRIVQPNIAQEEKWSSGGKLFSMQKMFEMASYNGENIDYVILPEVAIPYVVNDNEALLEFIEYTISDRATLVTGGLKAEYKDGSYGNEVEKLWNSVFVIKNGEIVGSYDKMHLVPFGEYVPFRRFIPFISKVTYGNIDFSSGEEINIVELDKNLKTRFLVCYEVIFPNEILGYKNMGLDLIVNLTNDAWFGTTSGPYQHLISAKFRAVEHGVPVIRAANTGISAYINSYGKIVDKIDLNVENYLDVKLSGKLNNTPYVQFRKCVVLIFLYFLGVIIISHKNNCIK